MVTVGEAAVIVTRWFMLMMGDLKSSLESWGLFQYLSLIGRGVKKDSPLVSVVVWWFVSRYVGRLVKVAVRVCKLQKLAQHLSDIKGFIHRVGTSSTNNQTSFDLLHELTDETEDPDDIMTLSENRIFELKEANNGRSLDQLVGQDPGYDWFAVSLYLSTVLGTVMIVRLWIGPPPFYGSPENYKWLPAVLVCTLATIVHTRHPICRDQEITHGLAGDILAILTQPILQEEPRSTVNMLDANNPQPIQEEKSWSTESIPDANHPQPIQEEQPRSTEIILDANHPQPIQKEQPHSTASILDANHPQPIQEDQPRSTEIILDANRPEPIQEEQPRSTAMYDNHPQPIQEEQPHSIEIILDANHPQPVQEEQPRMTESILDQLIQEEQPLTTESILDANQVEAAIAAILIFMQENNRQIFPISPPQPYLSDFDGGSSTSSYDEIIYYSYAPLCSFERRDTNLIVLDFIQKLREKTQGLPEADAVEMVRTVSRQPPESDRIYRLSDVNENQWIFQVGTKTFANPPELTSTRNFVMMAKITASLCHLIWLELDDQNWQLCHEVKKECFLGVVGQSLQKLVQVGFSFCEASWSADDYFEILTMFDALVDVLYNIRDLPLVSYKSIPDVVAEMMRSIKRVVKGTKDAIHGSNESTIHPATVLLLEVLKFFCRNRDMLQHLLDSGDYNCSDIFDYWARNLKTSAREMFPKDGRRFLFIMNNLYFVLQKKGNLEEPPNLDSQIKKCIKRYLDECWVPLVRNLDDETHCSLVKFNGTFGNICRVQKKWRVRTELKKRLRYEIDSLIVAKYGNLFDTLQANPRWRWRFRWKGICRASSQKPKTALQVKQDIRELFEL